METQSKHTPTPWQTYKMGMTFYIRPVTDRLVDGFNIATIGTDGLAQVDAEFIVQACNNYQSLVDAAKSLERLLDELYGGYGQSIINAKNEAKRTLRALKDAGEL